MPPKRAKKNGKNVQKMAKLDGYEYLENPTVGNIYPPLIPSVGGNIVVSGSSKQKSTY